MQPLTVGKSRHTASIAPTVAAIHCRVKTQQISEKSGYLEIPGNPETTTTARRLRRASGKTDTEK
jgi:hypothetical protein